MNVILAPGYLGFSAPGFQYFNGVEAFLEARYPVKVVTTQVNLVQGVEYRGRELRRQALIALGEEPPATPEEQRIAGRLDPSQPLHLVAHSMGSLDCRFLISPGYPDNLGARVATLTTIGGPHRGTPAADLLYADLEGQDLPELEKLVAAAVRDLLKLLSIPVDGLADLRTEWVAEFNTKYADHPDVRYFSHAGSGWATGPHTSEALLFTWRYIHEKTGEVNDGAVPVSSAQWGEFDPDLWPADHAGLIGHDLNHCGEKPPGFDYLARYASIVERLLAEHP